MSKFKLDPKTILDLVCFVGASVSVYYLINQVVNSLDGSKSQNKKKANATVQKLQQRHPGLELALDEYETDYCELGDNARGHQGWLQR